MKLLINLKRDLSKKMINQDQMNKLKGGKNDKEKGKPTMVITGGNSGGKCPPPFG